MKNPIELLSPAGNAETALAAFDAGADAVYCGLARFNARIRAENFSPEDLAGVIEFAHARGKKVYLVFNTLIYESELPQAVAMLAEISRLAPDALIIQDLGVAAIVKRYFPWLALHASTQMGIHNTPGVEFARQCGFRRVILERQLSLPELEKIAAASPLELEVFIHGSLCCSLSGRCLLSRYLGGGGGNRGSCKQPCRRRYDGEYRLSMPDLSGVGYLDKLRELHISSLKIEGRLRPPEYVWKCTRAYRMLLDAPENDAAQVVTEAEKLLASASGRAEGNGFFDLHRTRKMIAPRRSGVFGIPVGTVSKILPGEMTVTLESKLHLGDRLRLMPPDGGEGETFSLISMRTNAGNVLRAKPGTTVVIAANCRAERGMKLLKIGENGFDFSRQVKNLPHAREEISLEVSISAQKICVDCARLAKPWKKAVSLASAHHSPTDEKNVKNVFAAGAPENFRVGEVVVKIDGSLFIPVGVLKTLRRAFWEETVGRFAVLPDPAEDAVAAFEKDETSRPRFQTGKTDFSHADILPGFLPEERVEETRRDLLAKRSREMMAPGLLADGFYALAWRNLLPETESVGCRFPVAVTNHLATDLLRSFGVCAAEVAPELPAKEALMLAEKSSVALLPKREAPLLVTRAFLPPGIWHDEKGNVFRSAKNGENLYALFAADGEALPRLEQSFEHRNVKQKPQHGGDQHDDNDV